MKYLIYLVALFIVIISSPLLAACTPAAETITVTSTLNVDATVTQTITITPAPVTLPAETTTATPPVVTVTKTQAAITTVITQPATTATETSTITNTVTVMPPPTLTVMPPPTQESPRWAITYFYYYVAEETAGYWRFEWSLTIKSQFEYGLELLASINYLDDEGSIVYTGQASPLVINAGETETFLGFNIIPAVLAPRVASVAVELEET
jgi:hypothetical protein